MCSHEEKEEEVFVGWQSLRSGQSLRSKEVTDHLSAAEEILSVQLRYAQSGSSMIHALMNGSKSMLELEHFPRHDIVDERNNTRMYYHAHALHRKAAHEHGHFHLFSHGHAKAGHVHLVGISLDAVGQPIRLFTTNQWVTGETWMDASAMEEVLVNFEVKTGGRLSPVARWATAMVRLYLPEIVQLIRERDLMISRKSESVKMDVLFKDKRLDVVTQKRINLSQKIQQLGREAVTFEGKK
jgi:hypothetical protein